LIQDGRDPSWYKMVGILLDTRWSGSFLIQNKQTKTSGSCNEWCHAMKICTGCERGYRGGWKYYCRPLCCIKLGVVVVKIWLCSIVNTILGLSLNTTTIFYYHVTINDQIQNIHLQLFIVISNTIYLMHLMQLNWQLLGRIASVTSCLPW